MSRYEMGHYERQFRKGSRVTTMDEAPTIGIVEAVFYEYSASENVTYRSAQVRWPDGRRSYEHTVNLVCAREIESDEDEMTALRADTNTPAFTS